ncbi:hypothetical protein [Polynucleobacter sp. MWH-HuK1]|uniref:hypothetical protein n=1 Tax=Polynucleobacter sp. MWH-HuK1 TaxID=1743158 RepID=UPI001C0BE1F7|nr:hypothetical protein [Polynucleobacter sp. MWH-HuK1]MBU3565335.1 hypothetical protein [Polynucleobacter sp. MWH-HuK1]
MSDPKRHDIFEDKNGTRVAIKQVFPPNASGISFVEYKNLLDSNLRFLPEAEFLEQFTWVENFDSIDTYSEPVAEQLNDIPPSGPELESKDGQEDSTGAEPTTKPSRSE